MLTGKLALYGIALALAYLLGIWQERQATRREAVWWLHAAREEFAAAQRLRQEAAGCTCERGGVD